MRDLLPSTVAVAVAGPEDWTGELLPAEQACLGERAVQTRRRDFTAGRVCARRALRDLGLPTTAVPAAADRAPVWPAGVVGSHHPHRRLLRRRGGAHHRHPVRRHGRRAAPRDQSGSTPTRAAARGGGRPAPGCPAATSWPVGAVQRQGDRLQGVAPGRPQLVGLPRRPTRPRPGRRHVHRPDRAGPGGRGGGSTTRRRSITGRFVIADGLVRTAAVLSAALTSPGYS